MIPVLFPNVPECGPGRWEAWSELCDEIFRFGMRPEVARVAQDALKICLAASTAIRARQIALDARAGHAETEQLAVAAQVAYQRVEALREALNMTSSYATRTGPPPRFRRRARSVCAVTRCPACNSCSLPDPPIETGGRRVGAGRTSCRESGWSPPVLAQSWGGVTPGAEKAVVTADIA